MCTYIYICATDLILVVGPDPGFQYSEANDYCAAAYGTELATIGNGYDQSTSEFLIGQANVAHPAHGGLAWIGLRASGGSWFWEDGSDLIYTNWDTANPTSSENGRCAGFGVGWEEPQGMPQMWDEMNCEGYWFPSFFCNAPPDF